MSVPRNRFNFPAWNYGYTLGPSNMAGNGDYTMSYRGRFQPPGGMPGADQPPDKEEAGQEKSLEESNNACNTDGDVKEQHQATEEDKPGPLDRPGPSETGAKPEESGGEVVERPLNDILQGRSPIMFCNEQSKIRGMTMEWEQVSETGAPHDKIFTWSLKIGDTTVLGTANSKKGAKNKAAEEMVRKLDLLPRPQKRRFPNFQPPMPMPLMYNRMPPPMYMPMHMSRSPRPPPMWMMHPPFHPMKRARMMMPDSAASSISGDAQATKAVPKLISMSQNNPISKLYEYCKKYRLPEPIFETIGQDVTETKRTKSGFVLKKTKFTIQCSIQGKKYVGSAMTKKEAKKNAAEAAWAEIDGGVAQDSIDSLLQSQRNAVKT